MVRHAPELLDAAAIYVCVNYSIIILQVDTAWNAGDREGARRNSYAALAFNIASIIGGIGAIITLILYYHYHP